MSFSHKWICKFGIITLFIYKNNINIGHYYFSKFNNNEFKTQPIYEYKFNNDKLDYIVNSNICFINEYNRNDMSVGYVILTLTQKSLLEVL